MNPNSASGRWARFSARFDGLLLSAPQAGPPAAAPAPCADAAGLAQALSALCGNSGAWACARQTLAAGSGPQAMQRAWVQHQMLKLDGTLHMQQLGGALRQRLHRLAVKLHETAAVGTICPDSVSGPWDCGWLNSGPAAEAQAARFAPRRPTLVVAWGLQQPVLETFQAALAQGQQRFTHPVRLWVLDLPALA